MIIYNIFLFIYKLYFIFKKTIVADAYHGKKEMIYEILKKHQSVSKGYGFYNHLSQKIKYYSYPS